MTFSSKIKNELSRTDINNLCCNKAEISALLRTTGYITIKGINKTEIEFTTENAAVARRIFKILKVLYNMNIEVSIVKSNRLKKRNNYTVKIEDGKEKKVLLDTGLVKNEEMNFMDFDYGVPKELISKNCCKRAYLKGSFMGCGSISNPEKSYHGEFVNSKQEHSIGLCELMANYNLNAKTILRKDNYVSYIKEAEQISDLMNVMGAYNALLDFENTRAVKETRNRINRVINCETANLDKIVETSLRQIGKIKILKKYKVINKLPDNLRELAFLRLKYSNASLKELGEKLNPPLGKSGVNHRLKRIEEIADEIINNRKEV